MWDEHIIGWQKKREANSVRSRCRCCCRLRRRRGLSNGDGVCCRSESISVANVPVNQPTKLTDTLIDPNRHTCFVLLLISLFAYIVATHHKWDRSCHYLSSVVKLFLYESWLADSLSSLKPIKWRCQAQTEIGFNFISWPSFHFISFHIIPFHIVWQWSMNVNVFWQLWLVDH